MTKYKLGPRIRSITRLVEILYKERKSVWEYANVYGGKCEWLLRIGKDFDDETMYALKRDISENRFREAVRERKFKLADSKWMLQMQLLKKATLGQGLKKKKWDQVIDDFKKSKKH